MLGWLVVAMPAHAFYDPEGVVKGSVLHIRMS